MIPSTDWTSVLARTGLDATYAAFPDDVREAFASAQGLIERMQSKPVYTDEPAHVFQAGRLSDQSGEKA